MSAAAPMYIQLTRRGYLASILMQANPAAEWNDLEQVVERIAARAETLNASEVELLLLANLVDFPEKKFPDGGAL